MCGLSLLRARARNPPPYPYDIYGLFKDSETSSCYEGVSIISGAGPALCIAVVVAKCNCRW
jgi:hypothetical protein